MVTEMTVAESFLRTSALRHLKMCEMPRAEHLKNQKDGEAEFYWSAANEKQSAV